MGVEGHLKATAVVVAACLFLSLWTCFGSEIGFTFDQIREGPPRNELVIRIERKEKKRKQTPRVQRRGVEVQTGMRLQKGARSTMEAFSKPGTRASGWMKCTGVEQGLAP